MEKEEILTWLVSQQIKAGDRALNGHRNGDNPFFQYNQGMKDAFGLVIDLLEGKETSHRVVQSLSGQGRKI